MIYSEIFRPADIPSICNIIYLFCSFVEKSKVIGAQQKCVQIYIASPTVQSWMTLIKDFLNGTIEKAFRPIQTHLRTRYGCENLILKFELNEEHFAKCANSIIDILHQIVVNQEREAHVLPKALVDDQVTNEPDGDTAITSSSTADDICRRVMNRAHKKIFERMDPQRMLEKHNIAIEALEHAKAAQIELQERLTAEEQKSVHATTKLEEKRAATQRLETQKIEVTLHNLEKQVEETKSRLVDAQSNHDSMTKDRDLLQREVKMLRESTQQFGIQATHTETLKQQVDQLRRELELMRTSEEQKQHVDMICYLENYVSKLELDNRELANKLQKIMVKLEQVEDLVKQGVWQLTQVESDLQTANKRIDDLSDELPNKNSQLMKLEADKVGQSKPTENRSLLDKIKQSGKRAYCHFKNVLHETGQTNILQENELVTVRNPAQLGEGGHIITHAVQRMETEEQPEPPAQTMPNREQSQLGDLTRSVTFVTTIPNDLHDGRLIELSNNMVQQLKRMAVDKPQGFFGKVYISKQRVPGFNIPVVLKEIKLLHQEGNESHTHELGSVINEKIASRLMHFGIVPLLAYHDDHLNRKYYFISPYLENGDLYEAIAADRVCEKNDIRLRCSTRIKIMYQIACAIDFIHTGNTFRRTVLHMDIKSKKIVLDNYFNARLIDFGFSREFNEDDATSIIVSDAGPIPHNYCMPTKNHDYHSFGVVVIELITGLCAFSKEGGIELRYWLESLIEHKQQVSVWKNNEVVNNLAKIAVKCVASVKQSSINSEQIRNDLKTICRKQSAPEWESAAKTENVDRDIRCEICLVNEVMKVGFDGHDNNSPVQAACKRRIRICCSCMRNSYINPVKCHTCGETIQSFNANWGAILVAGYDEEVGHVFQNDIKQFEEVITSKVLPAMCINPQNVITLAEDMKGIKADEQLDQAFDDLSKKDIQTLLFVYSGHNDENGFQLGPNVNYHLDKVSLRLNKWNEENPHFGKVIAFLDCCFAKKMNLNSSLKLIQFNAISPTTPADLKTTEGSSLLNYVIQAFTARANGKICKMKNCKCHEHIRGNFITLHNLWDYLNEHIQLQSEPSLEEPYMYAANIKLRDTLLAYNCDFEVKFEFTIKWLETEEWKIYVHPMEFNEFEILKLILAKDILRYVYNINPGIYYRDLLSKFAEIISLEINTGPMTTDVQEIDNIQLLLLYWNSKRQLRCLARPLPDVNVDKPVGRCVKNVPDIQALHRDILQKCNITENQLTLSNLRQYKQRLEKKFKATRQYYEYMLVVDMIIDHAATQLQDTRLRISFFDLATDFTLVHMNLVKTTDVQ
ncbi:uncharacterized protein LOC127836849 isoform X2 [Dreissena polymorpha]|uniref:uncharacterized protein LOC127836849 isoform X2 n=1 Tax=Dreissena polymorpha TaxID=45954 RepID=UPI0022651716|nr:uncharacterized protein LOC127836849 isoform X2 [Dreissena polymorpha]